MIDPQKIRENGTLVKEGLVKRVFPLDGLESFIDLDTKWRNHLQHVDQLKQQRNTLTPKGKPTPEQLTALKQLSERIKKEQDSLQEMEESLKKIAQELPNIPHDSTPEGKSEKDNVEIKKWGTIPTFNFKAKSHDELGTELGILDFENAAKISGARFAIYRKLGAKLERALINFMLDTHSNDHGYEEILPPVLVNSKSMTGTGQLPKFGDDSFSMKDSDLWLSPTAEVQLTNLFANDIIKEEDLPKKVTAFTPCFRKESGSYGKDTSGLIRLHQFNKVELVQCVHPEKSLEALEELTRQAETILEKLNLPYRRVALCAGDLGFSSGKTFDLEVWFPSQNNYREISSCSNFFDFQARRAMIRYKKKADGKNSYLHTLNGSGLAVGRTCAAIIENFQTEDGAIIIPDVLRTYIGVEKIS